MPGKLSNLCLALEFQCFAGPVPFAEFRWYLNEPGMGWIPSVFQTEENRQNDPFTHHTNGFIAKRSSCYGEVSCLRRSFLKFSVKSHQHKVSPYLQVNLSRSVLVRRKSEVFPAVKEIHLVRLNNVKNFEDSGVPGTFDPEQIAFQQVLLHTVQRLVNHAADDTVHFLGLCYSFKTKINND